MEFALKQYASLVGSVFLLSLIFYPFELIAPAEKQQPFIKRLFNLAYVPFFLALAIFVLPPLVNPLFSVVLSCVGIGILPGMFNPQSGLAMQVLFAVSFALLWDLWQYWLWETHRFHHTETALNSTTQTRHHFLSSLLSFLFFLPVLVLLGPRTPHVVATFLMFRLWGFINHANVRLQIGQLTPMISGPQWHRIHHSIHPEHHNKNFATFFPFIDILFGTYYRPQRDEFPSTGLPRGEQISDLKDATITPFLRWSRSFTRLGRFLLRRIGFGRHVISSED
jgi:sterol desaturase/sphingolipid hydroxylase (fatty acid hydroxylase superfamily)